MPLETQSRSDGCVYCAGERGELPGTSEHIWPQSLGGGFCCDFFITDQVCAKCNHDSGLWVDGGFVRSFFIQSERSFSDLDFLDPKSDHCVSLTYLGNDEDFPCEDSEICERWIGPSGDHIYHIHSLDDPKWHSHAGGNIIARKRIDAGRTYVRLVDRGEKRMIVSLRSIKKHFKKSRVHILAEFSDPNFEKNSGFVTGLQRKEIEKFEIDWIYRKDQSVPHRVQLQLDIEVSRRFLAKIALGFGSKLLGQKFIHSLDAKALRAALWPNAGFDFGNEVRGSDFLETRDEVVSRFLSWPSAWSLYFSLHQAILGLSVSTPSGRMASIRVAELGDDYSTVDLAELRNGQIYVIVPGRKACLGPFSELEFISHKLGNISNPTLKIADEWRAESLAFLGPLGKNS